VIAVGSAATTAVMNMPTLVSSTPTAAAAIVDTIENVVADNKAQAQKIYQAAVDAAGTVVAVVSLASQTKTKTDTRRDQDCRERLPEPNYMPRDASNGNRATGVEACVAFEDLGTGTGTSQTIRPPGYDWAGRYGAHLGSLPPSKWINNCHLLASQLGGSGTDLRNLSTCSRATNANPQAREDPGFQPNMYWFETQVKNAVEQKQVVDYTVTPLYDGHRTVPYAYEMDAVGTAPKGVKPINLHKEIPNKIWGVNSPGWNSLGHGFKDGQPVPTGAMK
jgi:hypothetical protein